MNIQISNEHLFFVIESIWDMLDYRFKYHINQLVSQNSAHDFVQTVTLDVATLGQCYKAISTKGYGFTCNMADILIVDLKNQLIAAADFQDPENEYTNALELLAQFKVNDDAIYEAKVANGFTQILL